MPPFGSLEWSLLRRFATPDHRTSTWHRGLVLGDKKKVNCRDLFPEEMSLRHADRAVEPNSPESRRGSPDRAESDHPPSCERNWKCWRSRSSRHNDASYSGIAHRSERSQAFAAYPVSSPNLLLWHSTRLRTAGYSCLSRLPRSLASSALVRFLCHRDLLRSTDAGRENRAPSQRAEPSLDWDTMTRSL